MRSCRYRARCFGAVILAGWLVAANAQAADADARAAYNRGVDLYSRGDYNKAAEAFQQALNTEQHRIEAWTNYNLGNARFEQANAAASPQPAAGVTQLKEALLFFQRALEMDSHDQNAKYNYELTVQRLKELEQQQQKKQQENQQEKQQEKNQEKQPDSSQMNTGPSAEDKKEEAQKQPAGSPQEQKSTMPQPEKTNENQPERKGAAAQAGTQEEQQKMTPQEAQMLLDNFQREAEMPQQLLTPERQREEAPVGKDW